jgi:hypothetical protein
MILPDGDYVIVRDNLADAITNEWVIRKADDRNKVFKVDKNQFDILIQEGRVKIHSIVGTTLNFTNGGCCK